MAQMNALRMKLQAYSQNPQKNLDLSRMTFGVEGAKEVAKFLPQ
jgi:hypothetical protein